MPNDPVAARHAMARLLSARTSFDDRWFVHGGRRFAPAEVRHVLGPYLTEARSSKIENALAGRTYNLAVVLEGMVDTGNVAAVMRSCEAFGVQPFHAIDTARSYKHSKRTSQGADKWLDVWRWRATADCLEVLRANGYRIVAAHADAGARLLVDVDLTPRTAMVFGNELEGLTGDVLDAADVTATVPLDGFVQSLNVSVAVGLFLREARAQRVARWGRHGDLDAEDTERLRAVWTIKSVRHATRLLQRSALGGSEDHGTDTL